MIEPTVRWRDINKKLLNWITESPSKLKPYIDYDPNDLNDPNNPRNPNFKPKIKIDILDKDIQAVRNSINNIFHTKVGELPGEPEFGNNFDRWLFQQIDGILLNTIEIDIRCTLERWEPRVDIVGIDIKPNYDYNEVIVDVNFRIKGRDSNETFSHRVTYNA